MGDDGFQLRARGGQLGRVGARAAKFRDARACLLHGRGRVWHLCIGAKPPGQLQPELHALVIHSARQQERGIGQERDATGKHQPMLAGVPRPCCEFGKMDVRPGKWRDGWLATRPDRNRPASVARFASARHAPRPCRQGSCWLHLVVGTPVGADDCGSLSQACDAAMRSMRFAPLDGNNLLAPDPAPQFDRPHRPNPVCHCYASLLQDARGGRASPERAMLFKPSRPRIVAGCRGMLRGGKPRARPAAVFARDGCHPRRAGAANSGRTRLPRERLVAMAPVRDAKPAPRSSRRRMPAAAFAPPHQATARKKWVRLDTPWGHSSGHCLPFGTRRCSGRERRLWSSPGIVSRKK